MEKAEFHLLPLLWIQTKSGYESLFIDRRNLFVHLFYWRVCWNWSSWFMICRRQCRRDLLLQPPGNSGRMQGAVHNSGPSQDWEYKPHKHAGAGQRVETRLILCGEEHCSCHRCTWKCVR